MDLSVSLCVVSQIVGYEWRREAIEQEVHIFNDLGGRAQ